MNMEILLIDDDAITNFVHQNIIECKMPDTPIKIFYNGQTALDHIHANPETKYLVFLDLNMPIMNGWEFLEAIAPKIDTLRVNIHVLTSSIDPRDQQISDTVPFVQSFLEKPLDESVLDQFLSEKINQQG